MISDRPYMREKYQQEKTSVLTWLISAIIAGFVLQVAVATPWFRGGGQRLETFFGVTIPTFQDGWWWTLLTHSFLHSPTFILHVFGNAFALFLLGRELLPMLGPRRFLGLYASAVVVGGLAWTATHWRFGTGELIGATSAVDALFIVFACFFPYQEWNFLLLFLFPVTLKPKQVAWFLVGLDLLLLLAYEIPGKSLPFDAAVASSAHLGGMLVGYIYYRFVHDAQWSLASRDRADAELPRWIKRARKPLPLVAPASETPAPAAASNTREDIRAEVDRILDKINAHGFGALTSQEKRVLDAAKDLLSRR